MRPPPAARRRWLSSKSWFRTKRSFHPPAARSVVGTPTSEWHTLDISTAVAGFRRPPEARVPDAEAGPQGGTSGTFPGRICPHHPPAADADRPVPFLLFEGFEARFHVARGHYGVCVESHDDVGLGHGKRDVQTGRRRAVRILDHGRPCFAREVSGSVRRAPVGDNDLQFAIDVLLTDRLHACSDASSLVKRGHDDRYPWSHEPTLASARRSVRWELQRRRNHE